MARKICHNYSFRLYKLRERSFINVEMTNNINTRGNMKIITAVMFLILLSGCGSQYVGRPVTNMNAEGVCKISRFPTECSVSGGDFSIRYTIDKTGNPDEYTIKGTAQYIGSDTFTDYTGANFTLLIISNETVKEDIGIGGGTGSLDTEISFSRSFTTPEEVEATIVGCYMDVRG
jgi:hypothetical protein